MKEGYFYFCQACGLRFPSPERLTRCPSCQGLLLLTSKRPLEVDDFCLPATKLEPPCVALLENIRSAWNVGSILRTGEAAGFSHFFLCGITPTPEHEKVSKTALGAEKVTSWSYTPDALREIRALKEQGFFLWALETEGHTLWHPDLPLPDSPLALVVGNELCGIDPVLLEECDLVLELPMRGRKRSLNVSVAFGVIALWISAKRGT